MNFPVQYKIESRNIKILVSEVESTRLSTKNVTNEIRNWPIFNLVPENNYVLQSPINSQMVNAIACTML